VSNYPLRSEIAYKVNC